MRNIVGAVGAWEQEGLTKLFRLGMTHVYPVQFYACPGKGLIFLQISWPASLAVCMLSGYTDWMCGCCGV